MSIIPRVSSERREYIPIGYLDKNGIVSDSAFAIFDAPEWLFGIITSKIHNVWVKTVGGRLKTDYRYSATLCYNTFPFPSISETKKSEIEEAANKVLDARDWHIGKTLAELYDPDKMPEDLRQAHHELDVLVESCYQDKPFKSDEERLECLFKLYEEMTSKKK
jgi:type II restriction/modification system DNA methylase subunit YeeA